MRHLPALPNGRRAAPHLGGGNVFGAGVLPQQPVIEHAARNGRCGGCAKAGVFHNHGNGDHGLVGRCKSHIQRMIALVLGQGGSVVALVLPNGHGLGRAGFAAARIACARKYATARALLGHAHHGAFDEIDMLFLVAQIHGLRPRQHFLRLGQRILQIQRQAGREAGAAIDQRSQRMRQLQHGEVVVALPNAQRNGLARQPFLLLGPLVGFALPLGAGQHAAQLALQINAGALPKAQRLHEIVYGLHAHFVRQRVVIHIARLDDAAPQIDGPQRMAAAEAVVAVHPVARIVNGGARRTRACFQSGQCHEGFVGGTWWIGAPQRAVEQRLVDGFVQRLPVFLINAVHEQVAIEGGLAHHGQHLPVARVNGYQRATALAKQVFHHLLQAYVYRQHHIAPGHGGLAGQAAHYLAGGGDLHALAARSAVQH